MTESEPISERRAPDIAAIVLAGGRSRRFGSDKLAARIAGRSVLEHTLAAVRLVVGLTVVVIAPDDERPLPAGVRRVPDPRPFEGPLAGVVAGLDALPPNAGVVLVVGGDMPTLRPEVLRLLVDVVAGGAAAALLHDGIEMRPLPAAYRVTALRGSAPALLAAGERRLRALPLALKAVGVPPSTWRPLDPDGASLRDIDEPRDLEGAEGEPGV